MDLHAYDDLQAPANHTDEDRDDVQATGRQGRELGQRFLDEWYERVNQSRRFGR